MTMNPCDINPVFLPHMVDPKEAYNQSIFGCCCDRSILNIDQFSSIEADQYEPNEDYEIVCIQEEE